MSSNTYSYLKTYAFQLEQLEKKMKQHLYQLDQVYTGYELSYLKQQFQSMLSNIEKQKQIYYSII